MSPIYQVPMYPASGDTLHVAARETFSTGGWFGAGPRAGVRSLPESHTDFVLTVVAEDWRLVMLWLALLALCVTVVIWRLRRHRSND